MSKEEHDYQEVESLDSILTPPQVVEGEIIVGDEQEDEFEIPTMEIKEVKSTLRDLAKERKELLDADDIQDYLKVRDTLYTLYDKVTTGVEGALNVALETQQSRPFEVFNQLVNTTKDVGKELMALQKTYREIQKLKADSGEGGTNQGDVDDGDTVMTNPNDLSRYMEENG